MSSIREWAIFATKADFDLIHTVAKIDNGLPKFGFYGGNGRQATDQLQITDVARFHRHPDTRNTTGVVNMSSRYFSGTLRMGRTFYTYDEIKDEYFPPDPNAA